MGTINLALAQLRSGILNNRGNLKRIIETIKLASKKNADYVLFPELYLSGSEMREDIISSAEPIDGTMIKEVCKYAKENQIGVILGFPEREATKIYNTAVLIDKQGEIHGRYRKIHLLEFERKIFEPGEKCPVFKLPEGNIGIMISYDIEFPEIARILSINGVQLILVLSANKYPSHPHHDVYLQARAIENHIFIAQTNQVGLVDDTIYLGESLVIHPSGTTMYKCSNNEEMPVVLIDFTETEKAKGTLNYLENRRPTVYSKGGLDIPPSP